MFKHGPSAIHEHCHSFYANPPQPPHPFGPCADLNPPRGSLLYWNDSPPCLLHLLWSLKGGHLLLSLGGGHLLCLSLEGGHLLLSLDGELPPALATADESRPSSHLSCCCTSTPASPTSSPWSKNIFADFLGHFSPPAPPRDR